MKIFRRKKVNAISEEVVEQLDEIAQYVHEELSMFPTSYSEIVRRFSAIADSNFNLKLDRDYTEEDMENALSWYDDWNLDS